MDGARSTISIGRMSRPNDLGLPTSISNTQNALGRIQGRWIETLRQPIGWIISRSHLKDSAAALILH
jgi:hypothetical protein